MKSTRYFTYSAAAALLLSAGAVRAADESPFKFEFHGFITGSMFVQNQNFLGGTGQDNLFAAPTPAQAAPCKTAACDAGTFAPGTATKSGTFLGADARQSRYIFVMTGPAGAAFGATPKAYFEGDLLGLQWSAGTNAIENTQLHIRAAYAELKWGTTQLQIGQYPAQLLLAQLSASIAHIANPITFGTGTIGSRTVGIRAIDTLPMGDMRLELAGEILASKWADPARAGNSVAAISDGWASGLPMLGVRVKGDGKSGNLAYQLYVSGLYESVNLKHFGETSPAGFTLADGTTKTSVTPWAAEIGGNFTFQPVSLAFNVYTGKATGPWAGNINQNADAGDLGYWVQLGLVPNPMFGIYALFGQGATKEKDLRLWTAANGAQRTDDQLIGGIVRISDGGYTLAGEFYQFKTKYLQGTYAEYVAGTNAGKITTDGWQFVVSGHYAF